MYAASNCATVDSDTLCDWLIGTIDEIYLLSSWWPRWTADGRANNVMQVEVVSERDEAGGLESGPCGPARVVEICAFTSPARTQPANDDARSYSTSTRSTKLSAKRRTIKLATGGGILFYSP